MADKSHQGMRGTGNYSANQRPGNYGRGIRFIGSRVGRAEVKRHLDRRKRKSKGGDAK